MIILYTFGPNFGLPDPSPFVVKAMLLLKIAGLHYREDRDGFAAAPKGKLPYINDGGVIVCDSTFIRLHIEERYGFAFDSGLSAERAAVMWAVEKMCDEHLYWALMAMRWADDANFRNGPAHFFDALPAPQGDQARSEVRRQMLKNLDIHGLGRHSKEDIERLAIRDIDAIAAILGDEAFMGGDRPCAADAAVYAFVSAFLSPMFTSPICIAVQGNAALRAYCERIARRYFADTVTA